MADFTITDVHRKKQYTVGSSSQEGPYAFTFRVNSGSDLAVYVNSTLKTLPLKELELSNLQWNGQKLLERNQKKIMKKMN